MALFFKCSYFVLFGVTIELLAVVWFLGFFGRGHTSSNTNSLLLMLKIEFIKVTVMGLIFLNSHLVLPSLPLLFHSRG